MTQIEYPQHALLQCTANPEVVALRETFLAAFATETGGVMRQGPWSNDDALAELKRLIFHWKGVQLAAKFVYDVYRIWKRVNIYGR